MTYILLKPPAIEPVSLAVLGVYVSGRSKEKQALMTGQAAPTILGDVVKAIAKRK